MKIKTSELTGPALDWVVTQIHLAYPNNVFTQFRNECNYSTDWSQGGPIIEREEIGTQRRMPCMRGEEWEASGGVGAKGAGYSHAYGPTPLIAAMRCFVASRLGDEVDVPEELK